MSGGRHLQHERAWSQAAAPQPTVISHCNKQASKLVMSFTRARLPVKSAAQ
jgi:hypothetical protein